MKSVNKAIRKKDAMELLLGKPVYTDDIAPKDCLVVKLLRSPYANAFVKNINTDIAISIVFSIIISILVCTFAASLMEIFVKAQETAVIACGVQYLRIEGSFYCGIGCLFLLYGYYRAINKAQMSVVLTVISLGLRVVLAYILSVPLKAPGIWVAIVNHKNLQVNLIRRQKIPCYNEPVRM